MKSEEKILALTEEQKIRKKIQKSLGDEMAGSAANYVFDFLCKGLDITGAELCDFILHGSMGNEKYTILERFYYTWVHRDEE